MTQDRLAIFLPSLSGGGAERVMLNLAIGIADLGFGVDLVLAKAEGQYLQQIPEHIRLIDLAASSTLKSFPKLIAYLKQDNPRVMISAIEHSNILAIWAKKIAGVSSKIIITEHNPPSKLNYAGGKTSKYSTVLNVLMRLSYPMADHVVAVSKGIAKDLERFTPNSKLEVILNPVLHKDIIQKAQESCPHPWLEGPAPVILAAGRLEKLKDFSNLIQAFALLRKSQTAKLIILGEGRERGNLEQLIKSLHLEGDVTLPGFTTNPYCYIKRASVFVLSSITEGLPTVLIEALALGVKVVSTDCESGPREILEDGKYGRLVPIQDSQAMAKAIKETLVSPSQAVSTQALSAYTYEVAVNQYLELINQK